MKILQEANTYDQMLLFIRKNFDGLPEKFVVQYEDAEKDMVSLCTQSDIETMIETVTRPYAKAFVK